MSIKSLFNNKTKTVENAASGSTDVESKDFVLTRIERDETFLPFIDFSSASNFAKFGSAEEYYKNSIERIYNEYPYDGSEKEKLIFELSSSYLDKYIFDEKYPKTNGYVNFTGPAGGGSKTSGYGTNSTPQFIYVRGGIHVADDMTTNSLYKTFDKSVIYDNTKKRISSLKTDISNGITTEFWLKKTAFNNSATEKEVILDLWNGELSSSANYGRFTLALSGTATGVDTFVVTMQSGTTGFFEQSIGTATVTTSSLENWHHYAFSFISASSGVTSRLYIDGNLNESKSLGSTGVNEIGGLVNGYIGALQTAPSGNIYHGVNLVAGGTLSASIDDFRFWKTRRTSKQIYNNWYRHVGGGTNTDDANTDLGVYYKFNEGIVGNTTIDSVVLDYSGRLVNGAWTGYVSSMRSTSSAFTESGLLTSEPKDPIIHSTHADVSSLKTSLMSSGKDHDDQNPALLYYKVPQWIRDEDPSTGNSTKKLYQIIASYFDTLHAQITALPYLKNKVYPSSSYKALPFADRLLEDKGLLVSNLFADSNVLEAFGDRDLNKIQFEKKVTDIKNQIYTNIYNNIESIYKHKGTEGAIRNMLRCFGIDDELVKLNVYTDQGKHYFSDAFKHTSVNKKYIDFNKRNRLDASIFQTSSANHLLTYTSGSESEKLEQYNAISSEISIIVPKKLGVFDSGHFPTPFQSASIFGMHQALTSSADYTWATQDLANFQAYLVRDKLESPSAKFVLKDYSGNFTLESPVYKEIYSNEPWNISVRIKPEDYPIAGNVVTSSNRNYVLEFYGVNHAFDTVKNEFILSQSLNYTTGSAYLSNSKRFYIGSHRTNFTGSVLERTDIKVGRFNLWYDYVGNDEVKLHNRDVSSKGNKRTARPSTIFGKNLEQVEIPSYELLAADWDFETVSTSDSSGEFIVVDASSGSTDTRYGWIDNIVRRENRAKAIGFPVSSTNVISNEIVYSSKKELPEIGYSADGVTIKGEQEEYFIEDEDVSDNFFALEKSMYQTISEEMMRTLSTAQEMSNLTGEAVERYRLEYKKLNHVRRMFFEDVEEDPNFDRFTEYFKWIDSSVSYMVSQMFPMSVRFSKGISDVVESHLFERNKYQNKFPLITTHKATEGRLIGVGQSKYRWEFGHAPIETDAGDNDNCLWQKERAERADIEQRETIRQIIGNRNNAIGTTVSGSTGTYTTSTYGIRKFSQPVQTKFDISQTFHPGFNTHLQKNREYIWSATNRHSSLSPTGIPKNVLLVGAGEGQGIELPVECDDIEAPNQKKKFNTIVHVGKEATGTPGGVFAPINDSASYSFAVKGAFVLPFEIFSGSITTGYNSNVASGYKSDAVITNIHTDTTDFSNDIPLQGPFTSQWVGGHQSRHIDLNRYDTTLIDGETLSAPANNIDNLYTRPEAWRFLIVESLGTSDGALGMTGPLYGVTNIPGHPNHGKYPDVAKKAATLFRDGRTKRAMNIANIQTTTSSANHGNFTENYEIFSVAGGKKENNLFLRKYADTHTFIPTSIGNILPETTNPMTLIGQEPLTVGNVFGTIENNRQPDGVIRQQFVAGTAASGFLRIYGVDNVNDGDSWRIAGTHAIYGTDFGFEVDTNASSTYFSVAPTSSNSLFWNAIQTRLQEHFTVSTVTTNATFGNAYQHLPSPRTATFRISGSSSGQLKAVTSNYTLSFWLNMSTGSGLHPTNWTSSKNTIWLETSTTGSVTNNLKCREVEIDSSGQLKLTEFYDDSGSNKDRSWTWSGFYSAHSGTMKNLIIKHDSNPSNLPTAFVNGVALSAPTPSGFSATSPVLKHSDDALFLLGDNNFAGTTDFTGLVDDFSMWNVQLSSDEITELYSNGLVYDLRGHSRYANVVAWFDFEDPAGNDRIVDTFTTNITLRQPPSPASNCVQITSPLPATRAAKRFNLTTPVGAAYNATVTVSGDSVYQSQNIQNGTDTVPLIQSKDITTTVITGSTTRTIITSRFSAPGSIDTMSYGYLDAYSQEYSVHNNLNYRNMSVRGIAVRVSASIDGSDFYNFGGSGEAGTIRVNDHRSNRDSLKSLLSRHSGRFGIDPRYASELGSEPLAQDNPDPSLHKQQRNENRRPSDTSTILVPVLVTRHDNAYINSPIPRSDFQYKWVTSSLGSNYSITSGKQRMYGYAHPTGILSSSVVIDGDSGFVPAITFPTASEIFGV